MPSSSDSELLEEEGTVEATEEASLLALADAGALVGNEGIGAGRGIGVGVDFAAGLNLGRVEDAEASSFFWSLALKNCDLAGSGLEADGAEALGLTVDFRDDEGSLRMSKAEEREGPAFSVFVVVDLVLDEVAGAGLI